MKSLHEAVHALVASSLRHTFGQPSRRFAPDADWQKLRDLGSELWLDTGDRDEAAKLWNTAFSALTTNNTLLNREIQKGLYDDLVGRAAKTVRGAAPDLSDADLKLELAFILNAWHALRLVEQFDAMVSVELHTDLANDVERTVAYGKRYYAICPERFIVKVPLTPAGYLGARRLVRAGVPVNFTLGFSARQNMVAALLTEPRYCNVFMGRLNAFLADNKLGPGEHAGEKATLATQRLLRALRGAGRTKTKLIGASVRDAGQVVALAGIDVFTLPTKVAAAYRAAPPARVTARLEDDPEVPLASGGAPGDCNLGTLWDVPPAFAKALDALLQHDADRLSPRSLVQHFADAGFEDVFPVWTDRDIDRASRDGKIPAYAHWKSRLASGEIGLDALMNLSALRAFATDQQALDDHVRGALA